MLAHGFSNQNLLESEHVLQRKVDEFLNMMGGMRSEDGRKGVDIVKWFGYITWNIIGEYALAFSFRNRRLVGGG